MIHHSNVFSLLALGIGFVENKFSTDHGGDGFPVLSENITFIVYFTFIIITLHM